MGRLTTYSPVILPIVRACATFGATRDEIANYLGVTIRCFYSWQLEHEELKQALKRGAEASDERMEETLYRSGLAGNVTAMIFWLKNRRPDRWRDVQQIDTANAFYLVSDKPMTEQEWIDARAERAKPVQQPVQQNVALASQEEPTWDSNPTKPLE